MKTLVYILLAALSSASVLANPNFVTNPHLPYPPGCAQILPMNAPGALDAQAVKFFEDEVELPDAQTGEWIPVRVAAYRSPCSEPGRSLIWLEYSLQEQYADTGVEFSYPNLLTQPGDSWRRGTQLVAEPNSWGPADLQRNFLVSQPQGELAGYVSVSGERRWFFLLGNTSPLSWYWDGQRGLTPSQYNSSFTLWLSNPRETDAQDGLIPVEVPATVDMLSAPAPYITLSGRLSGNWVIEGAADQGVALAISGQVRADSTGAPDRESLPLVIFFSHYTFDAQGQLLWLTGSEEFTAGASEVQIPIEKVTQGEFRGSKKAHRETIGSVTLRSNSCNDLDFEYDYSGIGLGQGIRRLQRLFSLETAGYDCRDYEARVAANR